MKPPVFNHQQYTDLEADYMILKAENERLRIGRPIMLEGDSAQSFALAAELSETKAELAATKELFEKAVKEMCRQCELDYVERDKPMRCDECEWRGKGDAE